MGNTKKASNLLKKCSSIKEAFADTLRIISSREELKTLYGVSLYRNAVYLMINSIVVTMLGFVFWIAAARLYSPQDVGFGSALISIATLLSGIGTLGLGFGIVRFLPNSDNKVHLLNSCFTISFLASIVVAFIFLAGLPLWSPKLIFVRENSIFLIVFIIFIISSSFNGNLAYTFVGFRRAEFSLINGIVYSVLKITLVVALATTFKAFGIFASWALAIVIASGMGIFLFLPQILPRYYPFLCFQKQVINELAHFSYANLIGEILRNIPTWILPLIVVNLISAEANAYFYVSWTMATLLLIVGSSTSISFFAEGSYREASVRANLIRSLKMIIILLVPAVIIMLTFGDKMLLVFGREYSEMGAHLLWFLLPAAIPANINLLYLGIAQIEKKLKEIILINGSIAIGTLILGYLLLPHFGILGPGIGWLTTQTFGALILLPRILRRIKFGALPSA